MLRICLIVSILAGIGALVISQVQVQVQVDKLQADLKTTTEQRDRFQRDKVVADKARDAATAELQRVNQELETAQSDLEAVTLRAGFQEKRANELDQRLFVVTDDRNKAREELARWIAFGLSPDQIRQMIADNKTLAEENGILRQENRDFSLRITTLQNRLNIYEIPEYSPPMPPGLRGTVLAVDPKYQFVVVDVGSDDEVLEQGELLVSRSGKLVAKLKVLSVHPKRSIANILAEWKQAEVMEGDAVIVPFRL